MTVDVLLAIKPEYAENILNGRKKFEFRRKKPGKSIRNVYIYATSPIKKIVGMFRVNKIKKMPPKEMWSIYNGDGGIEETAFFKYFDGVENGYCFEIGYVEEFTPPIDPYNSSEEFYAPQNFYYFNKNIHSILIESYRSAKITS